METYREPLRTLIGQFEAAFLREKHNPKVPKMWSNSLWAFFSKFPRKSSPAQFSMADVEDWKVWRSEEGMAYNTIRRELSAIRTFFAFIIREVPEFADFPNPVRIPPYIKPRKTGLAES